MTKLYTDARKTLRDKRKSGDLTLKEVGDACGGKSPSLVSEWESGSRTPTYSDALALERKFGAPTVEDWGYDRATLRRPKADDAAEVETLAPTGSDVR